MDTPFVPPGISAGMGGPPPDMSTPPPQVQATPQQPPPQAPPPPNHHEVVGRVFNALMGGGTAYSVDPTTGQTVETPTKQPPGQLFRSILAASLLGGAAGAEGPPAQGVAGGVVRGGAAQLRQGQQQDLVARQQAQQQFQNQQKAAQEQREAGAAVTEDQLRKAQIAHENMDTLRTNQLIQGESFDLHQKIADKGKQHFADYQAAGLQPVVKDIPESEMSDVLKNRPGASTLDWEPTGVKVTVDEKGQPQYETQYTAYDPKGQIPVSKGTIDQWKADGMDKYYPELFDILKPGKQLDVNQYLELKRKDTQLFNDTQVRQKANEGTQEFQARLKETNAMTAAHLATAAHERAETSKIGEEKKVSQQLSDAYADLDKNGGDLTKVKPSTRVTIGESYSKMLPSLSAEIRSAQTEGDEDKVKSLMTELDGVRHLATQAMQNAPANQTAAKATLPAMSANSLPKGAITGIDPTTKQQVYSIDGGKTFGIVTPVTPKTVNEQNAERRQTVGELGRAAVSNPLIP